jgi:hypothetical protein
MNARFQIFALAAFGVLALSCGLLYAELPPGTYDQLKKEAPEVYQLKVLSVKPAANEGPGIQGFRCKAQILEVVRTKSGRKKGDVVQFHSYYVPPEVWKKGFVGPQSPPLLKAGWTGWIYLKPPVEGDLLDLAAYGRSFEPLHIQPQELTGLRLGVGAVPSPYGGIEVMNVEAKSLADKLGLRSGDRVVDINGTTIRTNADVRPALEKTKNHIALKFIRGTELIELTIRWPTQSLAPAAK